MAATRKGDVVNMTFEQVSMWPAAGGRAFRDATTATNVLTGDLAVRYSPGLGNEFVLQAARCANADIAAREIQVNVKTAAGSIREQVDDENVNANTALTVPHTAANQASWMNAYPTVVSDTDFLEIRMVGGSALLAFTVSVILRVLKGDPTITTVSS